MAKPRTRKTKASAEPQPQPDPKAALDGAAFVAAARPVLARLADDLLARATRSKAVTRALKKRHAAEVSDRRTAESFAVWQRALVDQVAAAWLLSCVFVRVLEDRGLLGNTRIAGPGAADSQHSFFQMAPSLTERDYLLSVFREMTRLPAARGLFDARHNPVWMLAPSGETAKVLLALFRQPRADAPSLRFGGSDTRFLGDLYQDLNDDVKKRYALLQTPRFVERFILDRTLDRALERFGLEETTLIDPTCGSGHFLLGAFDRLFERRQRDEPGLDVREAARKALDAVAGSDINPYAVAIARFRLTLSYLEKAGIGSLSEAPELPLHVVVADSLLHNPHLEQTHLKDLEGQTAEAWTGKEYALEDETAAREVLYRKYAAVVGNPPYITVKDAVLRDRYRELYASAFREYSLAVPFTERFFQLARDRGCVGMITANSFMKREFGKKMIQEYLPTVNLDLIVNTSGAYIPGHGTPTVLLFGTNEPPQGSEADVVLASRGEPTTPEDPEQGMVWRSIADHYHELGFENEFITVARVGRASLSKHPWSLGGGGAAELKELLEERSECRLADLVDCIGFSVITGEDNVLMGPVHAFTRSGVRCEHTRRLVIGEEVRDWSVSEGESCVWPNDAVGIRLPVERIRDVLRFLWPYREVLRQRKAFGTPVEEKGIPWWALREVYSDRMKTPLTIAFAFVATHNHFVLDRGGKVFNRSAPIIKLPESATEDDHLALLAYLNSSTACFLIKQVSHDKGSGTDKGKWQSDPAKIAFEFTGTQLGNVPVPSFGDKRDALVRIASRMSQLAEQRISLLGDALPSLLPEVVRTKEHIDKIVDIATKRDADLLEDLIGLQEELDWLVYGLFGLVESLPADTFPALGIGCRPFEVCKARRGETTGTDGFPLSATLPDSWDAASVKAFERRTQAIDASRELALIECPEYKRRWAITPKDMAGRVLSFANVVADYKQDWLANRLEELVVSSLAGMTPITRKAIIDTAMADASFRAMAEATADHGADVSQLVDAILRFDAVPMPAAALFTDAGLEKRGEWERAWSMQRNEDEGVGSSAPAVPPRYGRGDYRNDRLFDLRGKLDVPKERFISYPGCESDEDNEPVYGWAGWDHLQQAQALAALYQDRKTREGWTADRLTPMLAGLLELLPWLLQWHNEPNAEFDGLCLGDYFRDYLDEQCRELGLTLDDLRSWRPVAGRKPRGKAKQGKRKSQATEEPE